MSCVQTDSYIFSRMVEGVERILRGGGPSCSESDRSGNGVFSRICSSAMHYLMCMNKEAPLPDAVLMMHLPAPYIWRIGTHAIACGKKEYAAEIMVALLQSDLLMDQKISVCRHLVDTVKAPVYLPQVLSFMQHGGVPPEKRRLVFEYAEKCFLQRGEWNLLDDLWLKWNEVDVLPQRSIGYQMVARIRQGDIAGGKRLVADYQGHSSSEEVLRDVLLWMNELYAFQGVVLPQSLSFFYEFVIDVLEKGTDAETRKGRNAILPVYILHLARRDPEQAWHCLESRMAKGGDGDSSTWLSAVIFAWLYGQDEIMKRSAIYAEGVQVSDPSMVLAQAIVFALMRKEGLVAAGVTRLRRDFADYFSLGESAVWDRRWFWLSLLYALCGKKQVAENIFVMWSSHCPYYPDFYEAVVRGGRYAGGQIYDIETMV